MTQSTLKQLFIQSPPIQLLVDTVNKLVPEYLPLKAKVLKYTCLAIILASVLGIMVNIYIGLPYQVNVITGLCALVIMWLFFKMPDYDKYNRSGLIIILLLLITVVLNWFPNGGIYSSGPYFVMILLGFAAVILSGPYLWITITILLLTIASLIVVESYDPSLVAHHNPDSWQAKLDIIFSLVLMSYPLAWFIRFMSKANIVQYERAEEASRAKTLFLSQLSHELRTPLNSVIGFSNHMLNKPLSQEKQALFTKRIQTNGLHLLALVNQVLDLSFIESGKMELIWQDVNILQLLSEIEDVVTLQATEKNISYGTVLPSDLPAEQKLLVKSDPNRLRQVLLNLLSNAIKYTGQGEVRCHLFLHAKYVQIDIENTGTAIPQEQQKLIFEPFMRLPEHHNKEGIGMGLAISKLICEQLGCRLFLKASNERSTVFSLCIPYESNVFKKDKK